MSTIVVESLQAELGASEPWPDDVCLYQPYQVDQITFPDYANCLSVKTFLHMCGLNFQVELRANAEEMSPSGKVPFLHCGPFLVSELDPIIGFVHTKGFLLSRDLSEAERSEMRAYMALVENILVKAELYLAWIDKTVSNEVTKPRYGYVHPWPLKTILPWKKQREVYAMLDSAGWAKKTILQVCDEVRTCCQALSERLDKQPYFLGDRPTEVDALVFGHLYTLLTTYLPERRFAEIIEEFKNLTAFVQRIDNKFFKIPGNLF
ncbi:metaxin-2-like isoform X2 [Gigantopelta aegis]|uniref:metaxin-2-like isoform X2 n=1 Tax=Gigantopelta aegis TaxID=1735272 RepID=UPI001B888341|nr:metaxin-2-like isoform X2 [Gigantopelta aegis]